MHASAARPGWAQAGHNSEPHCYCKDSGHPKPRRQVHHPIHAYNLVQSVQSLTCSTWFEPWVPLCCGVCQSRAAALGVKEGQGTWQDLARVDLVGHKQPEAPDGSCRCTVAAQRRGMQDCKTPICSVSTHVHALNVRPARCTPTRQRSIKNDTSLLHQAC
jgi:hypothetical protein